MSNPGLISADADASDEAALIAALKGGEDAAFARVLDLYGGRLLAVARRILGREDEAQDALQEAMLSAFRGIDAFAGQSRLSTWLHRITVNAALQRLRRRRSGERSLESLLPRFLDDGHRIDPAAAWTPPPDDALQQDELRDLLRQHIAMLPPDFRDVLVLRDIEGLDTASAAAALEISPGAVKTRLHRARQALRTLLEGALP